MSHRVTPGHWCWTFKCLGCDYRYYNINPDTFHRAKNRHMAKCRKAVVSRLASR